MNGSAWIRFMSGTQVGMPAASQVDCSVITSGNEPWKKVTQRELMGRIWAPLYARSRLRVRSARQPLDQRLDPHDGFMVPEFACDTRSSLESQPSCVRAWG